VRRVLVFSYDGSAFFGSQAQEAGTPTVVQTLQDALSKLNIRSTICLSGRTDRGVHATGQVAHIDLPPFWKSEAKLKDELNRIVSPHIYIKKIVKVDDSFHARYSATSRLYRYAISHSETSPFESRFVTFMPKQDLTTLRKKAKLFEGVHNFLYFCKNHAEQKSTIREIFSTRIYSHKSYTIITFCGSGFLHSQVRLMVFAILNLSEDEIVRMLDLKARYNLRPAPPQGLYLAKVSYA